MTLDEFLATTKRFGDWWRAMNEINPTVFPLEGLSLADWEEHFALWLEHDERVQATLQKANAPP